MTNGVTLIIVDNRSPELAKFSIEKTLENIDCKEVITFSNVPIIPGAKHIPIHNIKNLYDYSELVLKNLWPFIETEYALITQWDGMAANKSAWTDDFFQYDYIGAIWPWPIQDQTMGNGGFSLRSRKLIESCRDTSICLGGVSEQNEDIAICVEYRELLKSKYGIKYAPTQLAGKFSTENYYQEHSFGFHGIWNAGKFFNKKELEYILELLPDYFWKDVSKVREWLKVIQEHNYQDLAQRTFELFKKYTPIN